MVEVTHMSIVSNLDEVKESVTPFEKFFDATVDHFKDFTEKMLKKGDHIFVTIYMQQRNGSSGIVMVEPLPDDTTPEEVNDAIKRILAEQDASSYVLVAEATQRSKSMISEPASVKRASELNGKEVIIFMGGDDTGMSLSSSYTLEELPDGSQRLVESIPRNRGQASGGLANLLQVNRTIN